MKQKTILQKDAGAAQGAAPVQGKALPSGGSFPDNYNGIPYSVIVNSLLAIGSPIALHLRLQPSLHQKRRALLGLDRRRNESNHPFGRLFHENDRHALRTETCNR